MRIFVSSTVFDLIDVRAEVAELMRSLGVIPVMSDVTVSDFVVQQDVNSIETCLINVDSSDEVLVILDQRYGPRLGSNGFENISATHLEYRRAVLQRRPIHVFVRDRLDADFSIWKKNHRSADVKLSWIQHDKDRGLLELLDEHSKLVAKSPVTNWYSRFTSSVDLKGSLKTYLKAKTLPDRLVDAIHRNEFPLFTIDVEMEMQSRNHVPCILFRVEATNAGGVPAFNFRLYYEDSTAKRESKDLAIVTPGDSTTLNFLYGLADDMECPQQNLIAEYESPIGVSVKDVFGVGGRILHGSPPSIMGSGRLLTRHFKRSNGITLTIED